MATAIPSRSLDSVIHTVRLTMTHKRLSAKQLLANADKYQDAASHATELRNSIFDSIFDVLPPGHLQR